ncbi:hypothetical protein F4779DRAFT_631948 [Xylariaceae sp. FL0662B]|nr:hypothetical protein F4779DRAFT_631948 [Xylariaceae sp. FL0662B]
MPLHCPQESSFLPTHIHPLRNLDSQRTPPEPRCDELPFPATKIIIGQHLWVHPSLRSWAWLIVGSFYDDHDSELWHTEVFLSCIRDPSDFEPIETLTNNTTVTASIPFPTEHPWISHVSYNPYNPPYLQNAHHAAIYNNFYHPYISTYWHNTMATQAFGRGWNPAFGWDPNANANANIGQMFGGATPGEMPTEASIDMTGYPVHKETHKFAGMPTVGMANPMSASIPGPPNSQGPVYVQPQNGYSHPVPVFPSQPGRLPNPHPVVTPDAPAMNMTNSTGGVGCEPGYNYFFAPEHTKLHVIKSTTPPWRLPAGMSMNFGAYHVPTNTTLAELMKGFGAVNPSKKKNRITEVIQGGNGRWYRGVTFGGDESDAMKMSLSSLGWDRSRTGRPGEKPVVWLWITKD